MLDNIGYYYRKSIHPGGALDAHRVYKITLHTLQYMLLLPLFAFCCGHLMETPSFGGLIRGGVRVLGGPNLTLTLTLGALPAASGSGVEVCKLLFAYPMCS